MYLVKNVVFAVPPQGRVVWPRPSVRASRERRPVKIPLRRMPDAAVAWRHHAWSRAITRLWWGSLFASAARMDGRPGAQRANNRPHRAWTDGSGQECRNPRVGIPHWPGGWSACRGFRSRWTACGRIVCAASTPAPDSAPPSHMQPLVRIVHGRGRRRRIMPRHVRWAGGLPYPTGTPHKACCFAATARPSGARPLGCGAEGHISEADGARPHWYLRATPQINAK